jgi:hypothetical protein
LGLPTRAFADAGTCQDLEQQGDLNSRDSDNYSTAATGALKQEFLAMCDYSLQGVASRPAAVGDKLTTRNFGTGTRGFGASEDRTMAVCLLPGAEVAFAGEVAIESASFLGQKTLKHNTDIFRQIDKETPHMHHDALEFPNGQIVLLTRLREGQEATVLQLPARPATLHEFEDQRRAAFAG